MSVRMRKWTTAKGEAKKAWVVNYTDGSGVRRMKTFAHKKEADAWRDRTRVDVREGVHTPDSASVTVAQAADKWLDTCRANGLERSTVESYEDKLLHIVPYLGAVKLSKLNVPTIREFEDRLLAEGRSRVNTKKIMTALSSIVGDAQERGFVTRNVCRDLRSRRKSRGNGDRRAKGHLKAGVDIPTPEEIRAFLGALVGRWRRILLTAVFTGLRASELRGLRWCDVDLAKGELHVRQRADCYCAIGRPKSEAGERTVPFLQIVANTLREWKVACPSREIVFPTKRGTIERLPNIVARGLKPAWIRAGVVDAEGKAKYTGMHSLRHFYASWCINRRADGGMELPLKTVQDRLGHSTLAMTADTYGHLFPRGDDRDQMEEAGRGLLG